MVFDLMKPWPFADSSVDSAMCYHVLEHLPDPLYFMSEAWRVLKEPAIEGCPNLFIRVPYGPSEGGFGDLTHVKYFMPTTFECFLANYWEGWAQNYQHESTSPFEIVQMVRRVNPRFWRWMRWPFRRAALRIIDHFWDGFCELIVDMAPVKSPEKIEVQRQKRGYVIACYNGMYDDELKGRQSDGPKKLVII